MKTYLCQKHDGSGAVIGSTFYVHETAFCDGTTLKGSGGCDLANIDNKFIRCILANNVANAGGCITWNAATAGHIIVEVDATTEANQNYQNDPGDSDGDGTSMYPGAYMVGKKHYTTYANALSDTSGTTC